MKFNKSYLLIPLLTSLLAVAGAWPLLDGLRATLLDGSRTKKLNSEYEELYFRASYAKSLIKKIDLYGEAANKCIELAELYDRNGLTEDSAKAYCNAGDMMFKKATCAKLTRRKKYSYSDLYGEAARYYSEAAERYKQLGDIEAYAELLDSAGEALYGQAKRIESREEKARLYSEIASKRFEAAEQYKQLGNTEKYAELLCSTGQALYAQANNTEDRETKDRLYDEATRNYHEAIRNYYEAAEQYKQLGNTDKYAELLCSIGLALYGQASNTEDRETKDRLYDEATEISHDVAELYKQRGDTEKYAEVLCSTGQALYAQANNTEDQETKDRLDREADNNHLKAAELYMQHGKIEESAQVNHELAQQLDRRANFTFDRGEQARLYGKAAERLAEEERLYREIGNVAEADNAASEREEMLFRKSRADDAFRMRERFLQERNAPVRWLFA